MRLTNEDLVHEIKLRLSEEKSIKRKMQLKRMFEILNEL